MAEAVTSIAGSILASLITQALEKDGDLGGVNDQLVLLENTVSNLRVMLDHAEEQYYQNPQIKDWVEKLKDAFYDAQDVLEEFNIEATRREQRGDNEMMKAVRTPFSSSKQFTFKKKMGDKVRVVRVRIEALLANNIILTSKELAQKKLGNSEETHSLILKKDIKGREDDKERVMKFLQDSNMKENVSILPIVGSGGLGKTALAQYVYGDSKFDLKMWVCVSADFNVRKIVEDMLACANEKGQIEVPMEVLRIQLGEKIEKEKYLLVLDNVWSIEKEKWRSLKLLLEKSRRGSKILITTRDSLVAKITGTTQPHFLKGLSENASIELLLQMADKKIEEIRDSDMLDIVKEIVRKCFGVPLVIRIVGNLLSEKSKSEWSYFKDHELPKVSRDDSTISVPRLSYDHLPSHLKQCFAFCSLFPKDYEMDEQTLVNLWVAEGFIQSDGSHHLEDIAQGYFMALLCKNFFQDYKKDSFNKGTCKMHDLMHDLACSVAGNECWAAGDGTKYIHKRTRHISYGSTFNLMGGLPISHSKASALRTFLSTTRYWEEIKQRELEANLHQLIKSFKRLRILGLHGTNVEKVPQSIYKLKHLTYLDLSNNNKLKRLPNSITRLQSLQTLNLHCCNALKELPSDVRKLVSLRNLYIDGCDKLSYLPCGIGELSSLQRLTHFILPKDRAHAKNYCRLGELKGLNIRGSLVIENLRYVTSAEVECRDANLMGKTTLESLELNWGDFNIDDPKIANRDEALLNELKPPSNLQKLAISDYKGESFPRWMMGSLVSSLPCLVEVSFVRCKRCKRLPPLDQLPLLESLYIEDLLELEYIESGQSSSSMKSFPSLLKLDIRGCKKLEAMRPTPYLEDLVLNPSMTSFPSLLKLDIHGCEKLQAMPPTPYLEELVLNGANGALLINQMMLGLNKLKRLNIEVVEFPKCLPEKGFQSLTSLESLSIAGCHKFTSLWQGMRHLSSLVDLSIYDCEELDISKDESHDLHNLRSVQIENLPKLTSLPQWLLQARNLERLIIWSCDNLKDISEQIETLQSLQYLEIIKCSSSLTSLPKTMQRLTSLTHLFISGCRELEESCKRKAGEDWDRIAHIPNIHIG